MVVHTQVYAGHIMNIHVVHVHAHTLTEPSLKHLYVPYMNILFHELTIPSDTDSQLTIH